MCREDKNYVISENVFWNFYLQIDKEVYQYVNNKRVGNKFVNPYRFIHSINDFL